MSSVVLDLALRMRDGVHLAGNLFRPAGEGPWPCLVNYMPYHKDGRGGLWYEVIHRFFADRGYASVVVDFRGLGCSEGINNIPFDDQEGRDGHDAIEWVAAQLWCNGDVGMWGTSYGGITALKAAAEQPAHLRAIVPIHATHDNYLDFLLLGGCPNGFWPNGDWGPRMIGYNLTPPLAPDSDGRLARLWAERLRQARPWCLEWYDQKDAAQRWARRVIPIEKISAATLAVCGWKDFYVQGTFDYFQRLAGPKKLLMGPWKHVFPNMSPVEPVNLLEMMVRWWDRWLGKKYNGIDKGPAITLFVQGQGVWRHEESWPPPRNELKSCPLHADGTMVTADLAPHSVLLTQDSAYKYDPTVGLDSLAFDPWTTAVHDPGTHNADDTRSLTFTTEPLPEDWDCTGQPRAVLTVRSSTPGLQFTAKLCDVDEQGRSRLVTMGWSPDAAAPAASHTVEIPLRATSHVFARGHCIRLSLALADFPRLWPTATPGEFTLEHAAKLLLPRTAAQQPPLPAPEFPPPGPVLKSPFEQESSQSWTVGRELVQQAAVLTSSSQSRYGLRDGGTVTYAHDYTASVAAARPAEVAIHVRSQVEVDRPAAKVVIQSSSTFTPTSVSIQAEIVENGKVIFKKEWSTGAQG